MKLKELIHSANVQGRVIVIDAKSGAEIINSGLLFDVKQYAEAEVLRMFAGARCVNFPGVLIEPVIYMYVRTEEKQ